MKKKNRQLLVISLIVGAILLFFLYQIGGLSNLPFAVSGNDQYIQTPTFMYYECAPATGLTDSPTVNIPKDGSWYSCPDNSDGCSIYVVGEPNTFLGRRFQYQVCEQGGNCQSVTNKEVSSSWNPFKKDTSKPTSNLVTLTKSQSVYITYQKKILVAWANTEGGSNYAQYKPFILWKNSVFQGGRTEYTTLTQGCIFPQTNNLIDSISNIKGFNLLQTSQSDYKLEPYKTRNFIDTYIPLSTQNVNFVTYNGQSGYCLNRQVFAISEVKTNSGTLKIVDSNFNTQLSPSVVCCPGDKEPTRKCNSNFQWEELAKAQCSQFDPCAGASYYPSGKSKELIRYNCVNSQCVAQTTNVECTTNSECIGNSKGAVCDTKTYQCSSIASPIVSTGVGNNSGSKECTSCLNWASNIFKSKENKCTETNVIKTSIWNPLSWIGSLTGATKQSNICPIYLIGLGILLFIALMFILLILGFTGGVLLIFKKLFSRKKRR